MEQTIELSSLSNDELISIINQYEEELRHRNAEISSFDQLRREISDVMYDFALKIESKKNQRDASFFGSLRPYQEGDLEHLWDSITSALERHTDRRVEQVNSRVNARIGSEFV